MFSSNQSGFRQLHSTLTCLLKNTDDWYSGLDLGKLVGLVFIDLKKAFDTVNHDILCQKLNCYGIHQRELLWFQSYLSNREQFCRVNGIDSEINSINIGIPQGSCLGPLLFIIYINDLPQAVLNSSVSTYTYDTNLCYQLLDINRLNEVVNNDLEKLEKWLMGNKLSLNAMKTQSMVISTKQKHTVLKNLKLKLSLKIKDHELEVVDTTKYLGLQIDNSLDWKHHISVLSSKISRAIGFLKHAKSILPLETLLKLYAGIVEPHFRYCCSVWGCCGTSEKTHLQKLQNRAARIITNSSFDAPGIPLVRRLGWKIIEELIAHESELIVFKSIHGPAPQYMGDLFTKISQLSSHNLGNTATDLRLPQKRSSNGLKCFSYRGAKTWNSLPTKCKQAITTRDFKSHL